MTAIKAKGLIRIKIFWKLTFLPKDDLKSRSDVPLVPPTSNTHNAPGIA